MLPALFALAQAAASPGVPSTDPAADARCIVVFGSVGARGTPEQALITKQTILYFVGKLRGRDPAVDVAATVTRAADAAKAAGVNARAEAERCGAEVEGAAAALRLIRPSAPPAP